MLFHSINQSMILSFFQPPPMSEFHIFSSFRTCIQPIETLLFGHLISFVYLIAALRLASGAPSTLPLVRRRGYTDGTLSLYPAQDIATRTSIYIAASHNLQEGASFALSLATLQASIAPIGEATRLIRHVFHQHGQRQQQLCISYQYPLQTVAIQTAHLSEKQ